MDRAIGRLATEEFDVLVIGGGILGTLVARDAAGRGLRTGLVERADFGTGASGNSLRVVHGGLRYLGRAELRRAFRAGRQRAAWIRRAPHLVQSLPVLVPSGLDGTPGRISTRVGALGDRLMRTVANRKLPSGRRTPSARVVGREGILDLAPFLAKAPVDGGLLYYDSLLYSSVRPVVEAVLQASEAGCAAANYAEAVGAAGDEGRTAVVRVRDRITDENLNVRTRAVVNATGATAPDVGHQLSIPPTQDRASVLAINLVTERPEVAAAVALPSPARLTGPPAASGVRRLFLVPWRDRTLIGTAYRSWPAPPPLPSKGLGGYGRVQELVRDFLEEVQRALPGSAPSKSDVVSVDAGLLPVTRDGELPSSPLWEEGRIQDCAPYLTVQTEKYTTAPALAERTAGWVSERLGGDTTRPSSAVLPGGEQWHPERTKTDLERIAPELDAAEIDHLTRVLGTRARELPRYEDLRPRWQKRVVPEHPVVFGQLYLAADEEMAQTRWDLLERRTELGAFGLTRAAEDAAGRALEAVGARKPPPSPSPEDAR